MKTVLMTFVFVIVGGLGDWGATQAYTQPDSPPQYDPVQITHGPVVENVTDTTAIIAWSTNVNAGTVLHYGADPKHLDHTAGMPWGGLTHRVNLKDLTPATTYYFKAESPKGQGTGTSAQTEQASFQTKPATQGSRVSSSSPQ